MKRQTITFQKENILSLADMKSDIRQKMSDSAASYILSIHHLSNTGFNWNSDENKMTMIRTWDDKDYDDYVAKVSIFKDETTIKLKDDGYTLTEVIDSA
tara:strand:+ start:282 stop:578 length:297 start_codon:yes stop_codon:yes gene_type:complete